MVLTPVLRPQSGVQPSARGRSLAVVPERLPPGSDRDGRRDDDRHEHTAVNPVPIHATSKPPATIEIGVGPAHQLRPSQTR